MESEPKVVAEPEGARLPKSETLNTKTVTGNLVQWLIDHAGSCTFLLAHAEDGVIWGRFERGVNGKAVLTTSHDVFPQLAQLRIETLWQCRMFGSDTEVLLWLDDRDWRARKLADAGHSPDYIIRETQMLWGDCVDARARGFTLLADGSEGLRHAVPLDVPDDAFNDETNPRPLRLHVRHYLTHDEDGNARIGLSRLCNVTK
jgi:CRISPR-associated protein (TIGR03984 family)